MAAVDALLDALDRRIVVLDGAMGTMVQGLELADEAAWRGERFARPRALGQGLHRRARADHARRRSRSIHYQFLRAGADIVETDTFTATSVALADYGLADRVARHQPRRRAASRAAPPTRAERDDGKPRWVAGSIGPTTKSASLSPDVNDPGARSITFHELVAAFAEQARALIEGGVDLLLTETHIDTLNCKAALYAFEELFAQGVRRVPVIASVTIPDRSRPHAVGPDRRGVLQLDRRTHNLLAVSINCALGADDMRPHVAELARIAALPRRLLPERRPAERVRPVRRHARAHGERARRLRARGPVNLVGGCCGTRPEHIAAIARAVDATSRRARSRSRARYTRLSGLEPLTITPETNFIDRSASARTSPARPRSAA